MVVILAHSGSTESGDGTFSTQAHPGSPCRGLSFASHPLFRRPIRCSPDYWGACNKPGQRSRIITQVPRGRKPAARASWERDGLASQEPKFRLMKLRRNPFVTVHV